jgi:hypothetical protein
MASKREFRRAAVGCRRGSLAWQPGAALVGAASGMFAGAGPPTLAPIESSAAFLVAYQD